MITVSAPGKIHLMGEHAVVYGKPALLSAINKRLSVTVSSSTTGLVLKSIEPTDYLQTIVEIVMKHIHITQKPDIIVTVTSDISAGYHLGSSAAVSVATVGALLFYFKKIWNPTLINQLAYEAEKVKHGNPSGGDNTACTFGGLLWYRKELECLKSMWQLPFKSKLNKFYLVDTGKPNETTGDMVSYVHSRYAVNRFKFNKLFDENEEQVKRIAEALKSGNEKELVDAIRRGEWTLERMGVVSKIAQARIRKIESSGGAAKILGGGGRKAGVGFLLCYAQKTPAGATPILLGEEGVRLEERV